jgi:hypothetical protein
MAPGDELELEEVGAGLPHWPDADPPADLDRAVRRQAHAWLAARRAAVEAERAGAYPAWLLGLTAVLLAAALALSRSLPLPRLPWPQTAPAPLSPPLAPAWLALLASNLLAVLLAPALFTWRKAHGE